jgi:hypothetical protein
VVGCTTGSRGEVPGERKPVIRDGEEEEEDDDIIIINLHLQAVKISDLTRIQSYDPWFRRSPLLTMS